MNTTGTGTTGATTSQLESTLYSLPLEASWAPDLWGKVRNTVRQAQYSAQISAADLENERLTEQAALAEYFFEIRGQDALQKLFDETVVADQKQLDLTRSLYESGMTTQISVVEAQTTLQISAGWRDECGHSAGAVRACDSHARSAKRPQDSPSR